MKKLMLMAFFIACNGCRDKTAVDTNIDESSETESTVFTFNDLDKHWSMLTEMESEEVILEPCDSANIEFTFKKTDNGWEIEQISGQEAFLYDVISTEVESNDVVIDVKERHQAYELQFILRDFSMDKNVLMWEVPNMPLKANFVNSKGVSKFKVVKEPESDCM